MPSTASRAVRGIAADVNRCEKSEKMDVTLSASIIRDLQERLEIGWAFDLEYEMEDEERVDAVLMLFSRWILPCLRLIATEAGVKEIARQYRYPLRIAAIGRLPQSWWPNPLVP
jgi:hypothetical protein